MKNSLLIFAIAILTLAGSCKKNKDAHVPPNVTFESGGNYTSADRSINHGDSILVGLRVTKTEDDLRTLNVSYAYDGSSSPITWAPGSHAMTAAEYSSYGNDYYLVTRNQAGTEKWTFTISDRDGNITQKSITLTVQ